jgi:large subunit ribosomal protein L21
MYAIVKTGGKQYRVERGQRLLVERLAAEEGASVQLQPLMYRSEEQVFDAQGLERVQVTARVLGHERGEKLRVVKFKPKRGYKRRTGHRQELTRIEITEIAFGGGKGTARKAAKQASAGSAPAGESGAKQAAGGPEAAKEASENGA